MSFDDVTNCYTDEADKVRRPASSAEERSAWDRYAAAAAFRVDGSLPPAEFATACATVADAMLAERRKRFGSGA